jgi:hypothetical protein
VAAIPVPRLPVVVFAAEPPPRSSGLPPLDVAGFVGFAQRGPLDLPVMVEDATAFAAVFGGPVSLARRANGARIEGNLPGSVAAFFANGGRRCHVVRVAGPDARPARFRVPGLVALTRDGADACHASIAASSPGRWGDALRLAARLEALPLPPVQAVIADSLVWSQPLVGEGRPESGDVLRITWLNGQAILFSVTAAAGAALRGTARRLLLPAGPDRPALPVALQLLTTEGSMPLRAAVVVLDAGPAGWTLELSGKDATSPTSGDLLRLESPAPDPALIFPVAEQLPGRAGDRTRLLAPALLNPAPMPLPTDMLPWRAERLRLDLRVEYGIGEARHVTAQVPGLAFDVPGARFWGDLTLLGSGPAAQAAAWSTEALSAARAEAEAYRAWSDGAGPGSRLPSPSAAALAGLLAPLPAMLRLSQHLPLALPEIAGEGIAPQKPGSDGLAIFDPRAFVDPALVRNFAVQEPGATLLRAAEDRYQARGLALRGMHALMFVDEVALLAVPDATHPSWALVTADTPEPVILPPPVPDRAVFAECGPAAPPSSPRPPEPSPTPDLPLAGTTDATSLLKLHGAMLRLCHARRDMVALLSLPEGTELPGAAAWEEGLRLELAGDAFGEGFDADGLSYAAAYHPWLLGSGDARLPPEGAVAGLIARRERSRGAWIAPANEPLAGVLDLEPDFDDAAWAALLERRINLVRRGPRDFRALTAHSLSGERSLLQLSVRRLMILLRKLALLRGQELVFDNNDERLREAVRAVFEEVLTRLFERGAFAGRTPAESFRVLTGPEANPPEGIEQGQLVTRILVAPSEPMEFLVVRLSRVEDGVLRVGGV